MRDFYRFNSADEDTQLAAVELADGRVVLAFQQEALAREVRYEKVDTYEYFGKAAPGVATSEAGWQIVRLETEISGNFNKQYANNLSSFTLVWDDRASYTYA